MIGSASGKKNVSKAMKYLLQEQIIPIFAVPRKPFSQTSIEGNNSVFSRKFWNRIQFKSIQEVDMKLEWFNDSSERYCHYEKPKKKKLLKKNFISKIYFIIQVKKQSTNRKSVYWCIEWKDIFAKILYQLFCFIWMESEARTTLYLFWKRTTI